LLKKSKFGDVFEVSYRMSGKQAVLDELKTYEMKPGEDEPMSSCSASPRMKERRPHDPCIVVTRFRTEAEFQVPMARGSDGKMAPREDMMKIIKGLRAMPW